MSFLDVLTATLRIVAEGQTDTVGTVMIGPPDIARQPVQLIAAPGSIRLEGVPGFEASIWKPEHAAAAVAAYCAEIKGE
jgi:hypothetical protein